MARSQNISIENNFIAGLKTEFTGLNFPENACTDSLNVTFSNIGKVDRRLGFDYEHNYEEHTVDRTGRAISDYVWDNADGAGLVDLYVKQVGLSLHFFKITSVTFTNPLSTHRLVSTVDLSTFVPSGGTFDETYECQFSSGQGYLFVFHHTMDPIYCVYAADVITATAITVKIRDREGIEEAGVDVDERPSALSDIHRYNLTNQGWNKYWKGTSSTSLTIGTGSKTFTTDAGLLAAVGDRVIIYITGSGLKPLASAAYMAGIITAYTGTSMTVNVTATAGTGTFNTWNISPQPALIETWNQNVGNFPSNSDVWWRYKRPRTSGTTTTAGATQTLSHNVFDEFDPANTADLKVAATGPAPKGFFVLEAWNQQRDTVSGITGLTDVSTSGVRPRLGVWFQGRVWYAGVDANKFNEDIYFSQIVENKEQFGKCYQVNDPTSEDLFDFLPSDGGVIRIQGAGVIYKLFPIQNGLVVFSKNGIWFISGSQGIGFTATDYTVSKISSVRTISHTSFVSVQGFPMWWNDESIYYLTVNKGEFSVQSITQNSIATAYRSIPVSAKRFARGDYDAINLTVQWAFRNAEASTFEDQYAFNFILSFNVATQAFYSWSLDSTVGPSVCGIKYINYPGGVDSVTPAFKYLVSRLVQGVPDTYNFGFAEQKDTDYVDWFSVDSAGADFDSYFITGYKLHGKATTKFQTNYIIMFSDNSEDTAYTIQSVWDYATRASGTGKFSNVLHVQNSRDNFSHVFRKHKLRGNGLAMQFKVSSISGEPFSIVGWSAWESSSSHV